MQIEFVQQHCKNIIIINFMFYCINTSPIVRLESSNENCIWTYTWSGPWWDRNCILL